MVLEQILSSMLARRSTPPLVRNRASASAPEVAGQQDPHAPDGGPHDERQERQPFGSAVAAASSWGSGREDLQHHGAGLPPSPGPRRMRRARPASRRPGATSRAGADPIVGRGTAPPVATAPTRRPRQRPGEPAGVVGVEVRQEHQRQRVDAQPVQAAGPPAPTSGPVSTSTASPQPRWAARGVALPDVAGDDDRVRRRPAAHDLPHRPAEHDQADHAATPAAAAAGSASSAKPPTTSRPVSSSAPPGPAGQPAAASGTAAARSATSTSQRDRPAREPDQHVAQRRQSGAHERGRRPSTVAGATAGAASRFAGSETRLTVPDRPATSGAVARPAAALTARASASTGRPAALPQPPRPAGREQHDGGRRDDRQGEAGVAGQPRIDEQQHAHRGAEGRHRGPRPADARATRATAAHGGRAHAHWRSGRASTTKPTSASPATAACTRRSAARRPQRPEDAGHHDRDVRARTPR